MSRTLSANYTTYNVAQKKPVVRVTFSGVTRGYVSDIYSSISANDKKLLMEAIISLQKLDVLMSPFALIGDTSFQVLDKDDDVTTVLNGDNLHGVDITTALGFQEIVSGDFLSLPVTTIDKIQFNDDNLSYRFISKDARKLIGQNLHIESTQNNLNGAINAAVAIITLDSTTGFIDPTNIPNYMRTTNDIQYAFVLIERELIAYTTINGNNLEGCVRGFGIGSEPATHVDDAEIQQVIFWEGQRSHEVLLNVLMGTNDGSGHAHYDLSQFDTGYGIIGNIGLTETEIDIEEIQQISYKTMSNTLVLNLALHKKTNAITFIEEMILKPNGWFMYLKSNGKLTINSFDRIHIDDAFSSAGTLDNDDIISISMESREDLLINEIRNIPPSSVNGQRISVVSSSELYQLDESVTNYGVTEKPFEIDTTPYAGMNDSQAELWFYKWFYFFGNTPATLKMSVTQQNIALEPGDYIQITRDSLPFLRDGTKGWTDVKALITGQKYDLHGAIELEALSWDLYTRITNAFSFTSVTVTDRQAVAFSANNTAPLEAEDGYQDFTNIAFDWCILTITVAKPGEGAPGSNETIGFGLHIQDPAGTDSTSATRRYLQYFTEDSDTITYKFIWTINIAGNLGVTGVDRIKVDWYERSSAAGGKQPTILFTTFEYGDFGNTISP